MPTPYSTRPKVTQLDISNGFVTRYFVQNISTKLITEVDKKQYEAFKTNVLYGRIDFPWIITGLANDTLATDGNIIYGTKHKNTVTTAFYNKKMPGLTRLLSNPLEGFQGTRNAELVIPTSQPTYNSNIAGTGTGTGRTFTNWTFIPATPPSPPENYTIQYLGISDAHYAVLRSDNTLWTWAFADAPIGNPTSSVDILVPLQVSGSWVSASVNFYALFGIKPDGTLWADGGNGIYGTLGLGEQYSVNGFTQVGIDTDWKIIGNGNFYNDHTLVIKENGTLWATGRNLDGELGVGDTESRDVFVQVGTDTDWKYAHMAYRASFAIKNDGTLWAWGYNSDGMLGLGTEVSYDTPQQVTEYSDWVKVVGSYMWSIGLRANGTLWFAGGDNGLCGFPEDILLPTGSSLIGDGTPLMEGSSTPATYSEGTGSVTRTSTNDYSYVGWTGLPTGSVYRIEVTSTSGTVYVCGVACDTINEGETKSLIVRATGGNEIGIYRLVDNGTSTFTVSEFTRVTVNYPQTTFTQIGTDTDWVDIDMGDEYHIARKSDGSIYTWGANYDGMIGNGQTDDVCTPYAVDSGSTGWTNIGAGNFEAWAVKNNEMYFWGGNYLGLSDINGTITNPNTTPVKYISSSVILP